MTRRVGVLPLAIVLGGVLSSGCLSSGADKPSVADDAPRRTADGSSRVAASGDRPSLPPNWRLREPPAEAAIRQVTYPDEPDEPTPARRGPAAEAAAEVRTSPRKGPPPDEPSPGALPDFEIKTKPEEPLLAALRCYLDKRPAEAVEHLKACDRAGQDALLCLLPLAVRLSEGSLDRAQPEEMAEMVKGLRGVETSLGKRAALEMEMHFCRQVRAFGDYEPIPNGQAAFEAGSGGQAGELIQVYAEVHNFASEAQGPFQVTKLASWAEIRDYDRKTAKRVDFDVYTDRCRSPRQDYFIRYSFRVPADLPPGPYTLWIFVKDVLAQPARPPAGKSLDFRVIASGPTRGSRGESGGLAAR